MQNLHSGYLGYFMVESQILHTKLSKDIIKKVGEWDKEEQKPIWGQYPNWKNISDDEKFLYLSYHHELKHFLDITSLPAGAFYWRVWHCIDRHCTTIFDFLKELQLLEEVSFPVVEWMNKDGKKKITSKLLEHKNIFRMSFSDKEVNLVFNGYSKKLPNLINKYKKIACDLFNDTAPCARKYVEQLNFITKDMKNCFITDRVFESCEYERIPNIRWLPRSDGIRYSQDNLLSFIEIFELRAYLNELRIIRSCDQKFLKVWFRHIKKSLSKNLYTVIKLFSSKNISYSLSMYLTDIALSGSIDMNCHFNLSESTTNEISKIQFYNNWPTYRFAKLLDHISDFHVLNIPDVDLQLRIIELAYSLFGYDTLPDTGMKLSRREMIPREFRTPYANQDIFDFVNFGKDMVTETTTSQRDIDQWHDRGHLDRINSAFAINQESYLISFLQLNNSKNIYMPPCIELFKDFINFKANNGDDDSTNINQQIDTNYFISALKSIIHSQLSVNLVFSSKSKPDKINMLVHYHNIKSKSLRKKLEDMIIDYYGDNLSKSMFVAFK